MSSETTQSRTDTARRRLEAIVEGVSPSTPAPNTASSSSSSSDTSTKTIPPIKTIATTAPNPRVKDRVIIITGANSVTGIGRAAAHQFAANGARAVYACDFNDDNLTTHKHEIESLYPHCTVHPVQLDVGSDEAVESVVRSAVDTYGRLDVMFANAGIGGFPSTFDNVTADEYMEVMRVNALGVFLCFKHAAVAMRRAIEAGKQVGGSLVGTASVAGLRSNAGGTPYSASKAAVVSMAQTFAYQLSGTGIRANAVCPGLIETGMTQPMFDMARERGNERKLGQLNPTKRGGIADEIARVALFLGSDEASYVNGQAWAVCGGLSAGHPFVPGKIA